MSRLPIITQAVPESAGAGQRFAERPTQGDFTLAPATHFNYLYFLLANIITLMNKPIAKSRYAQMKGPGTDLASRPGRVRRPGVLLWLLLMAAWLPAPTLALGLGQLQVASTLAQPFDARIPVSGVSDAELDSLSAGLADAALFRKAGIEPIPYLYTLRFAVVARDKHHPYIHITSREPLKEPSLDFLIEVRTTTSTLVHHCVALFDPPQER